MKNIKQYISRILIAAMLLWTLPISPVDAVVCQPYQGCTGTGTATTTDVGKVLTVASSSPFLTYSFTTPSGGGSATTTINGASGPTLTLLISTSTNTLSISTSSSNITITIPSNIGYFINDSGFLTSSTAASTYVPYTGGTTNVNLGAHTLTVGATSTLATSTITNLSVSGKANILASTTIGRAASSTDETLDILGSLGVESSVGVDAFFVKSTGNVGIGTSNPSTTFQVVGTTTLATTTITSLKSTSIQYPIQWIMENPTASENDGVFIFNASSTISKVVAVNKTAGDTVTFNFGYSPSRATATSSLNNLFSSAQVLTSTTTPTVFTINASSTPNTGDNLIFWTTAASSTQATFSLFYSEN